MLESNSVNEQRTPDTLTTENELICEKLLGWRKLGAADGSTIWDCRNDRGDGYRGTPSFTAWAEAGLILDWLMSHIGPGLTRMRDGLALDLRGRTLTPAIVRAAALEYIKAVKP